jgi:hypothetical protein
MRSPASGKPGSTVASFSISRWLADELLAFCWGEWAQMGIFAAVSGLSGWAQDPEALIVFTLELARRDPRLFDELLDWLLHNESLTSVRRLHALCIDDADRALVQGTINWLAHQHRRGRSISSRVPRDSALVPLFYDRSELIDHSQIDEGFAAAGLICSPRIPSGKSGPPDLSAPINLAYRLREILGLGARAETMRVLLTTEAPWMNAQALACSTAYAKRNVHEALTKLAAAGVIDSRGIANARGYRADHGVWAGLLGISPDDLPAQRDWPQLLSVLRRTLLWLESADLASATPNIRASRAGDLLEIIGPDLDFAGVGELRTRANVDGLQELAPAIDAVLDRLKQTSH